MLWSQRNTTLGHGERWSSSANAGKEEREERASLGGLGRFKNTKKRMQLGLPLAAPLRIDLTTYFIWGGGLPKS